MSTPSPLHRKLARMCERYGEQMLEGVLLDSAFQIIGHSRPGMDRRDAFLLLREVYNQVHSSQQDPRTA